MNVSAVHGFSYVHERYPICQRVIWAIFIMFGFFTSGFLVYEAFEEWQKNPVLTTLDTIAAPINEIQFPTVTICSNEYEIPENWAFTETLLNLVAFSCGSSDYEVCHNETAKVRKDFAFLIKNVLKVFTGLVFQGKILPNFNDFSIGAFSKYTKTIVDLVNNGNLTKNQVKNWPNQHFGNYYSMHYALWDFLPEVENPSEGLKSIFESKKKRQIRKWQISKISVKKLTKKMKKSKQNHLQI